MKESFIIAETTTVQNLIDFLYEHFPKFIATIKNTEYEDAEGSTLLKSLFVFQRELPLTIEKGIEFDDTFVKIVTKTGMNMSYAYYDKVEIASYELTGKTTIREITDIFNKHFPLFKPSFQYKDQPVSDSDTLSSLVIPPFKMTIYDQFSSTKIHFESDSGLSCIF